MGHFRHPWPPVCTWCFLSVPHLWNPNVSKLWVCLLSKGGLSWCQLQIGSSSKCQVCSLWCFGGVSEVCFFLSGTYWILAELSGFLAGKRKSFRFSLAFIDYCKKRLVIQKYQPLVLMMGAWQAGICVWGFKAALLQGGWVASRSPQLIQAQNILPAMASPPGQEE